MVRKYKLKGSDVPSTFIPQFWREVDQRSFVVKEVRRRYRTLKEDCGADTYQKDVLVQRAVFIALQLETMEITAAQEGKFDAGVYTQMTNTLLGLLKALGLERQMSKVVNLKAYVKDRKA